MSDGTDTPLPLDFGQQVPTGATLSGGARRTQLQRDAIARGRHPANGLPIIDGTTCGTCAHLERNARNTKTFWKCPHHALGTSHSEASDIRRTWPGCARHEAADQMTRSASISPDGVYRYRLERRWAPGPTITFVMLNPSTADGTEDDPTIRRCIGFAQREGAGTLVVVNLYAYRATDPSELLRAQDPRGPDNALEVKMALCVTDIAVVAWGAWWTAQPIDRRPPRIAVEAITPRPLLCLGTTATGQPRHPLYVQASQPLVPWPTP